MNQCQYFLIQIALINQNSFTDNTDNLDNQSK